MEEAESAGLCPKRLSRAFQQVEQWVATGRIHGAAMLVGREDRFLVEKAFGRAGNPEAPPIRPDTIFLIASLTKPFTTSAVCLLLERGLVSLDQPAREIIPEMTEDKKEIRLIHLLTHTSGLPDMLPENVELRREHQPLEVFIEHMCRVQLIFPPGTRVQYQSCGIALLAEVVRRVTGQELRDFIDREFFQPLGMKDSSLGRGHLDRNRISLVKISAQEAATDWNWNTDYWHGFGAPWGGMFSTVADYGRFLQMIIEEGERDGVRIFSPATVALMTRNHIDLLPGLDGPTRRANAWGLGWMMPSAVQSDYLGNIVSPSTCGHGGATGTGAWADPETGVYFVLFTNQPGLGHEIGRVSNMVAAAVIQ